MQDVDLLKLIFVIVLLGLSGIFSGLETVFFTLDRLGITAKAHSGHKRAQKTLKLIDCPNRFLATVLTSNNLINTAYASIFALALAERGVSEKVIFILTPVVLLIFGETLPKVVARNVSNSVAFIGAHILEVTRLGLYPLIAFVENSTTIVQRWFKLPGAQVERVLSRYELTNALFTGYDRNPASARYVNLLAGALNLTVKRLYDIMTPRITVAAIASTTLISDARRRMLESQYQRLVVYGSDLDDPQGYVTALDLALFEAAENSAQTVKEIIRPLPMAPESLPVMRLREWLRRHKTRFAGVFDEYGGFAGVVSLDDIAEELVGPILEESRHSARGCLRLTDRLWLIDGKTRLSHLTSVTGLILQSNKASAVAGYVIELAGGALPEVGAEFNIPGGQLRVISATPRTVQRLRLMLAPGK